MDKFTGKCVQKKRTAQSLRRFVCDDNEIALSGYSGCLCSSPCFFGYERSLARIAGTFTQDGGGLPGPADLAGADSDRLSAVVTGWIRPRLHAVVCDKFGRAARA